MKYDNDDGYWEVLEPSDPNYAETLKEWIGSWKKEMEIPDDLPKV